MPSAKPSEPPAFDAVTRDKILNEHIRKPDGSSYQVFTNQHLQRLYRWVGSLAEFDGVAKGGLKDVVEANAIHLDAVESNLNAHKAADANRHQTIDQRLAALEAAAAQAPFPG